MNSQKKNAINEHWVERFSQYGESLIREPIVGDITRWTAHTSDGTEDSLFTLYDWSARHGNSPTLKLPVVEWATHEDTDPFSLEVHLLNGRSAQIATVIVYQSYADRAVLQFLLGGENAGDAIELHNKMQILTNLPGTLVDGFRITVHGYYSPVVGGVSFGAPEASGSPHLHHPRARDDWRKKARQLHPRR